jgi:hypothetical protein
MAIKAGWSSQLDENFGFGGGSENSPFEAERVEFGVAFIVKVFLCYIYIKKRYRYDDELGSKKIWQPSPSNGGRNACWYFLTHTKIICKRMELPLQHFTQKYSGYRIFNREQRYSSS